MSASKSRSKTLSSGEPPPGLFFTVSAPSGTGKTTVVKRLLKDHPEIGRSVSYTTREPRAGEKEGVDYYFTDEKTFREMKDRGRFFEWEEVHGACYGTPKEPLLKRRQEGKDTVLDIDTRGALNLKRQFPDTYCIFLVPPSLKVLEERLRSRMTEGETSLKRRLENARQEMGEKNRFDCVIINDDLERAYEEVKRIILQHRDSTR